MPERAAREAFAKHVLTFVMVYHEKFTRERDNSGSRYQISNFGNDEHNILCLFVSSVKVGNLIRVNCFRQSCDEATGSHGTSTISGDLTFSVTLKRVDFPYLSISRSF